MAGDGGGASIYFNKTEPEQAKAMQRELKPGDVFFDIGANVGYYSILASKLVGPNGSVVALEPAVRNLAFLERHVVLNKASNVRILPFACSSANGTARFSTGPNSAMGGLADNGNRSDMLVPTITLDTLASEFGLMPDVIKMDVEGAEAGVLDGGMKILTEKRPSIFLSTHSVDLREKCLKKLEALGYKATSLIDTADPHEFLLKAV